MEKVRNMCKVVCQRWELHERGEETLSDGCSLHRTEQDRAKFVQQYHSHMPAWAPDRYLSPNGNVYLCFIDKKAYEIVAKSECGIFLQSYGKYPEENQKFHINGYEHWSARQLAVPSERLDSSSKNIVYPQKSIMQTGMGEFTQYIVKFFKNDGGWHDGWYKYDELFIFSAPDDDAAIVLALAHAQKIRGRDEKYSITYLSEIKDGKIVRKIPLEGRQLSATNIYGGNVPIVDIPVDALEKAHFKEFDLNSLL